MADTDNVERVLQEVSASMNRFLTVASIGELFVFAIFVGILSGIVQYTGKLIFNGFTRVDI
jgi:hypothetical protein